jgi:hypothetical protein
MSNLARTVPHLALVRGSPANEVNPPSVPPPLPSSTRPAARAEERARDSDLVAPSQTGSRPILRPRFLYGDSSPFPYDCDFIDLLHHAVSCGVALMRAHHAMSRAASKLANVDRTRREERTALLGIADAVKRSVSAETMTASEVARRTAGRALAVTRAVVETELAAVEADAQRTLAAATMTLEEARVGAARAVEELARAHDLPGTEIALRLAARDAAYDAVAILATPYGVEAAFTLAVPQGHAWSEIRRVSDFEDDLCIHVPQDAGWFSKRVQLAKVKLGKLFVREVAIEPGRCSMLLSKSTRGQGGFRLELDPRNAMRVVFTEIAEADGSQAAPFELTVDDAAVVLRLWRSVQRSARDLAHRRAQMARAMFDGKPLAVQDPLAVCDRLVRALAPTANEIARRAGAPGELVLRRDAGTRRRDEIYITKAELVERIETLPPPLRRVFDALDLDGPRSPRAPSPSMASYSEISDEDIVLDP